MFCACIANIHRQTKVLLILLNYFKIQLITFKTKKTPAVGKIVQFFQLKPGHDSGSTTCRALFFLGGQKSILACHKVNSFGYIGRTVNT